MKEPLEFYLEKGHQRPITVDIEDCLALTPNVQVAARPMAVYVNRLLRHDSLKLAEVILHPERFMVHHPNHLVLETSTNFP
mgnify:CR=1 FL=1